MIIANYKSTPHYQNIDRKWQYSVTLEKRFVKFLKNYFIHNNATHIISDFTPVFGFAMIQAAHELKIPCVAYLPFMKFGVTWNDDLKARFNELFNKTQVKYTDTREFGDWKYRYNYENIVSNCDVILFNKPQHSLDANDKYVLNRVKHYQKKSDNVFEDLQHVYTSFRVDKSNYELEL